MIALQVEDVKPFMNKLLKEDTFDDFEVVSLELSMAIALKIDGTLDHGFFSATEQEQLGDQTYIRWPDLKTTVLTLIKGNKSPATFKIVFALSQKSKAAVIEKSRCPFKPEDIHGFSLNILYENHELKVITGTNYKTFTLDKNLEHYFDDTILRFFTKHEIPVSKVE